MIPFEQNKYKNTKSEIDGKIFASKREAKYYLLFKEKKAKGEIKDFAMQVPFELVPSQKEIVTVFVKGKPVRKEKVVELAVKYVADFVVEDLDGTKEVFDVKGFPDQKYPIKRKLLRWVHGIIIQELR
jgi:hypothetical protein